MTNKILPGAVIFAKNVDSMTEYYQQVFGLTLKVRDGQKSVLESDAFSLVIHAIPDDIASGIDITHPPQVRERVPLKLYLPVASIAQAREKAKSLGGEVYSSDKEWSIAHFIACDGFDPEGNVIQLRQAKL